MSSWELSNVQILGGLLILVSLYLLFKCKKNKQKKKTLSPPQSVPRPVACSTASVSEGLRNYVGGLKFHETFGDQPVASMHDLENHYTNRKLSTKQNAERNIGGLRWQSEGMVGVDEQVYDQSHTGDVIRKNLVVGSDVITPLPHETAPNVPYSVTGNTIKNVAFKPEYTAVRGFGDVTI